MATKLKTAPHFTEVLAGTGAIAADAAVVNDTNFPLTRAFEGYGKGKNITVYWTGSGTLLPFDFLDLQILFRDVSSSRWLEGPRQMGVKAKEAVTFPTHGSSLCCIRVLGVTCAGGTTLSVQAATATEW